MFAKAYALVRQFMQPVIISIQYYDKSVGCNGANFVILNDKGWIITVAHIFDSFQVFKKHRLEIAEFQRHVQAIQENQRLTAKQRKKSLHGIKANSHWITKHSLWWGKDGVSLKDTKVLPEADLVVGRVDTHGQARGTL